MAKIGQRFDINLGDSSTEYLVAGDRLFRLDRRQEVASRFEHWDVFGDSWILFYLQPAKCTAKVQIDTGRKIVSLERPTYIFMPSFALLKWKLSKGHLAFRSWSSDRPIPGPREAILFRSEDEEREFGSLEDILDLFPAMTFEACGYQASGSRIAAKAKSYLDRHYQVDQPLEAMAQEFQTSLSTLSHVFKRCFGLSPQKYRLRLRMAAAEFQILLQRFNVTDSCFEAGFSSYSEFARQFSRLHGCAPSHLVHCRENQHLRPELPTC